MKTVLDARERKDMSFIPCHVAPPGDSTSLSGRGLKKRMSSAINSFDFSAEVKEEIDAVYRKYHNDNGKYKRGCDSAQTKLKDLLIAINFIIEKNLPKKNCL